MPLRNITKVRIVAIVALLLLLSPVAVSALTYQDPVEAATAGNTTRESAQNVTFVAAQGAEYSDTDARIVALDTNSRSVIWEYDKYYRYFDIDPIGNDRILFSAARGVSGSNMVAVVMNWRTGEVYHKFPVPKDTHDVDYLGNNSYAVAQKERRAYVYNIATNETTWEYDFRDEYPSQRIHLNDIDSVNNGSEFLLSPRNIDQVMLINRSTNETEWVLGEEGNYDVLNHQHNPVLLSKDPVTVLVADSENDRVIEYERTPSGWNQTWVVNGLSWPRDADRLPNGNTMIADSNGQRVLEVTPAGNVVWEFDISKGPYDIERLQYGDEPAGPTMAEYNGTVVNSMTLASSGGVIGAEFDYIYELSQWVVPSWVSRLSFSLLLVGAFVVLVWLDIELSRLLPSKRLRDRIRSGVRRISFVRWVLAPMEVLIGIFVSVAALTQSTNLTTIQVSIGVLLAVDGGLLLARKYVFPRLSIGGEAIPAVLSILVGMGPIALAVWNFDLSRRTFLGTLFLAIGVLLFVRGAQHIGRGVPIPSNDDRSPITKYVTGVLGSLVVLVGIGITYTATKPTTDAVLLLMVGLTVILFGLQIADYAWIWQHSGFGGNDLFLLPKVSLMIAALGIGLFAITTVSGMPLQAGLILGVVALLFGSLLEEQDQQANRIADARPLRS